MKQIKPGVVQFTEEELEASQGNWAEVELYRHEHGELPPQDDTCKDVDFEKAFKAASRACKNMKLDPFNASTMLWYAGELLKGRTLKGEIEKERGVQDDIC